MGSGRSEVVLLPGTKVSEGLGGNEVKLGGNDTVVSDTTGGVDVSPGRSDSVVEFALIVGTRVVGIAVKLERISVRSGRPPVVVVVVDS